MDFNKGLSVKDIADMFETEEFWEDFQNRNIDRVYIEPPDNRGESDEDSGDESGGLLDNLSGRQLQASAEVVLDDGQRIGNEHTFLLPSCNFGNVEKAGTSNATSSTTENWSDEDYLPLATFIPKRTALNTQPIQWLHGEDLPQSNTRSIFPEPNYSKYIHMSPVGIFEAFATEDVIQLLVEESNRYALFVNSPDPKITSEDIKCFLAILIVTGYDQKPSKKSYWDSGEDLRNLAVYHAMRRDRFIQIMRFLHCADNTNLDQNDKMTKLNPLINKLKRNFMKEFVPEQEISYDESMIEYYGRHGCKQFIRGKPIRCGYKVWSMNSKSGYLVNFEVYQGSIPSANENYQKQFGKATAPLLQLVEEMPQEIQFLPFRFYFDNLFTSIRFLLYLRERGYDGTGTIRENRLPKNCPIRSVKEMKKAKRGSYNHALTADRSIVVTRWMDNSVVTVGSSIHAVVPVSNVDRYSASEKKKIGISRPHCIGKYNEFMGGTDQMDANLNVYRIGIRGKKWWWPIFTWLIDCCVQNSWIIYKKHNPNETQLQFRRHIAQVYLKQFQNLPKTSGRVSSFSDEST